MSKHKKECRCVECRTNKLLKSDLPMWLMLSDIRRLRREHRKAMRLLMKVNEQLHRGQPIRPFGLDHSTINAMVAKWRVGK